MINHSTTSRRLFLGGSAALLTGAASYAANRSTEIESRIAKHDLKNISKDDLPTPCMIVDQ